MQIEKLKIDFLPYMQNSELGVDTPEKPLSSIKIKNDTSLIFFFSDIFHNFLFPPLFD